MNWLRKVGGIMTTHKASYTEFFLLAAIGITIGIQIHPGLALATTLVISAIIAAFVYYKKKWGKIEEFLSILIALSIWAALSSYAILIVEATNKLLN